MGPTFAALFWLANPASAPAPDPDRDTGAEVDPVERRAVVFMLAEGDETAAAVVDAIQTQFADLTARLEPASIPDSPQLRERLTAAREHANSHAAIGVFWLEVEPGGALLLHLVDPEGARMLVRRVEPSPESDTAAIQTVAVIARGFASALLEGRSIGFYRVEADAGPATDAEAPPLGKADTPPPAAPARGRLRLGAAYYGAIVAPQGEWRWQNGVALSAAWQWRLGIYAGLGYDITQRFSTVTASDAAMNTITSEVRRHPAAAILGYQHGWAGQRLGLEGELRFLVDVHTVEYDEAIAGSVTSQENFAPFFSLSPRVGLHFRPVPYFSAQLTVGAEIVLTGSDFAARFRDPMSGDVIEEKTYLTPRQFRPLVLAGLSFYL